MDGYRNGTELIRKRRVEKLTLMALPVTHKMIFHRDTDDIIDWCVASLQRLNRYALDRKISGQYGRGSGQQRALSSWLSIKLIMMR